MSDSIFDDAQRAAQRVDVAAARIHRRRALVHYDAAARFAKLGLVDAQRAALDAARAEDEIADRLEGVKR